MRLQDCTVLVVEDHEFQRRTMVQILGNLGAPRLLEAADAAEALTLVGAGARPDIVICDLDLPGEDGLSFLAHLAGAHPGAAVVIASGLDEDVLLAAELRARELDLRVLAAVRKPLTARRLLDAVEGPREAMPS